MSLKSQKQRASLDRGYRAGKGYSFSDSDRALATKARSVGRPPLEDPPQIVPCPYCQESVLALRRRYFDAVGAVEALHQHQPRGPGDFRRASDA